MIYDVSNLINFEVKQIEIGKTYQYKEGSIIFNFVLTEFKNDGEYVYLTGELTEKVKKHYNIDELKLTLIVKPFYYGGMIKIMEKDTYWNPQVDDHTQKLTDNQPIKKNN